MLNVGQSPGLIQLQQNPSDWSLIAGGLGKGIETLAQAKMQQIQKRHQQQAQQQQIMQRAKIWENVTLPNGQKITPEMAYSIAQQDPKIQEAAFKEWSEGFGGAAPQAGPALQQSAQEIQAPQQQMMPQQEMTPEQVLPTEQPMTNAPEIPQNYSQKEANKILNDYIKAKKIEAIQAIKEKHQEGKQAVKQYYAEQKQQRSPMMQEAIQPGGYLTSKQKAREEHELKKAKALREESHEHREEEKVYQTKFEELHKKTEAAKENILRRDVITKNLQSGNTTNQATLHFFKGLGIDDLAGLVTGETNAIHKAIADFRKGAKAYLGANPSEGSIEGYMKSVPDLLASSDGIKRVVAMGNLIDRGIIEENRMYEKVHKENPKLSIAELDAEVEKRLEPTKKKLNVLFEKELARSLTQAEKDRDSGTGINALAYGAGAGLSALGSIVKKASSAAAGIWAGGKLGGKEGISKDNGKLLGGLGGLS